MLWEANLTRRALIAALGLCWAAPAGLALAQSTLPPAPYAQQTVGYQPKGRTDAAPRLDRYGGLSAHAPVLRPATAPAYAGPHLSWTGKTVQTAASAAPAPLRGPEPRAAYALPYGVQPRARLQYPSMAMAEPTAQPAPASAPAPEPYSPPAQASAAPTSIYAPPPPAAASAQPVRTAAATGQGPRLYSLHRDYGMQPDPIPLAPQFFGPTADLSAPETPEVGHRARTAAGALVNAPTDAGGAS